MNLVIAKNWLPIAHVFLDTGDVESGMCSHYHKSFYEVPKFIRLEDNDLQTVKGTTTFHSVRNTGIPGIIEVWESSCFCEPCFLGEAGECKNKDLVKPYRWAKVCESNDGIPTETLENKLWNNYRSVKYKLCKLRYLPSNRIVRKRNVKLQDVKFKIARKRAQNATKFNKSIKQKANQVTLNKNPVKRNETGLEPSAPTTSIVSNDHQINDESVAKKT